MKLRLLLCVLGAIVSLSGQQKTADTPPSNEEQARILNAVRTYASDYTKRLPDFICTQVTRRYLSETKHASWNQRPQVIVARLSFFGQREDYKVISVNGKPSTVEMDELGGAVSRGEFGTQVKMLFAPSCRAGFTWKRWARLRNRRMHVYAYSIQRANSQWHIKYDQRNSAAAGYKGLIYVDGDMEMLAKVTAETDDIPPKIPILKAWTELDYDFARIGGNQYLLPLRSQTRMRTAREEYQIEMEFRDYRKFGSESTISFDTPEPLPKERTEERPLK